MLLDQRRDLGRVRPGHVHERVRVREIDRPVRALLRCERAAQPCEAFGVVSVRMDGRRCEEQLARVGASDLGRHRHVARQRQEPPVEGLCGEEVVGAESDVEERPGTFVTREAEPERGDEPVEPRLEDVPLVEAVLAQREPGVDRGRMDGRRRREARRPALDVGTGEERMVGVPFEKAPPERIEVDEGYPRVLGELRLDQPGQLVEAAAQSSCSTG